MKADPTSPASGRARRAPRATRDAFSVILPIVVATAGVVAILYMFPSTREFLERRERLALDETHIAGRRTLPREDVVVLGIDDASLKLDAAWPEDIEASPALQAMQKQWPWPRRAWAYILDKLFEAGAKQVFLDITFKNPSHDPEDDRLLREALQRHQGKVVLGVKFEEPNVNTERGDTGIDLMVPTAAIAGDGHVADDYGLLNFWPDNDGKIRSVIWHTTATAAEIRFKEKVEREKGTTLEMPVPNPEDRPVNAVSVQLARRLEPSVAVPAAESSRLRFSYADAYKHISIYQMFIPAMWEANLANGGIFRDKTVLIGAIASDLQDIQAVPFGEIPGVNVHGHALTALLAGAFVYDAPWWYRWAAIVLAALASWAVMSLVRMPIVSVGILLALGFASQWLTAAAFDRLNLEVPALPFMLSLGACTIAGITGTFVLQLREARKLRRSLGRYTSPEFVDVLLTDKKGIYEMLGGADRTVSILFSDVRGFTSMSEKMAPSEIVGQLNEYLSRMVEIVFVKRGLVDKFIGDAVMALWGSLRADQSEMHLRQDATDAVHAALLMRAALVELNASWRERGIAEYQIGIGVHQGYVIAGNIGSLPPHEKMDITVIGDSVNLASRLEGITKEYGVDLIISDVVHRHVKEVFLCRSADLVAVKGKAKPVEVFTVLGPIEMTPPAGLEAFERAMRLYRSGDFTGAGGLFHEAEAEGLDDKLTKVYQERCRDLITHPPEKWDGVYVMTKK